MINNTLEDDILDNAQNHPPPHNNAYQKKVAYLKHKIVLSVIITALLSICVAGLVIYRTKTQNHHNLDILDLESQINDLKKKSADIETMVRDAKRFKLLWNNTDAKKKDFTEIKISNINDAFVSLTKEYNVSKPSIKISVPEVLSGGVWKTQDLDVALINFNITFDALTDKMAIDFLRDFIKIFPGYVIVSNFEVKRGTKGGYSDDALVRISNGEFSGLVACKIDFSWYYLKPKITSSTPPQ